MAQTFGGPASSREFALINAVQHERPSGRFNGSAEIARMTDEMEAEMYVDMDADNGDVMDAKTTDEMKSKKDAEILDY